MNTVILPMAYRRFRHSVRRSSQAERILPKMKGIEFPIKAETGEVATHRFLSVVMNTNNTVILAHSRSLSNDSVVTV
jgi:hypothetical protein